MMHEREGPRKINTCPRIEKEEIVTIALNIPSSHNLSFENGPSNIFFYKLYFRKPLKDIRLGGNTYRCWNTKENSPSVRIVWREGSLLASEEVIMKRYVLKIHYFLSFKHPPPLWEPRSSIFHTRAIWQIFLSFLWSIVFKKQSIEEFQCLIYALWMLYLLCNRNFLTPWFVA